MYLILTKICIETKNVTYKQREVEINNDDIDLSVQPHTKPLNRIWNNNIFPYSDSKDKED